MNQCLHYCATEYRYLEDGEYMGGMQEVQRCLLEGTGLMYSVDRIRHVLQQNAEP